jgi:ribonuclease I
MWLLLTLITVQITHAYNFTYFDLALKQCDRYSQWSIHGFWPEYNQTSWPQFCDPSRYKDFKPATIAAFRDLMDKYWYVCNYEYIMENWAFWTHEWQKHGTCQPLPPAVYFRRTIDIFLDVQKNKWHGCCLRGTECLIHINQSTYKWTGKC